MSEREQYGKLADDLGHQADELEERNQALGEEIGDVRQDWERKRSDEGVPGAPPPPEDSEGGDPPDDEDADDHDDEDADDHDDDHDEAAPGED